MDINLGLFLDMLNIDSTSSKEGALADFLEHRLPCYGCKVSRLPLDTPNGQPVNLLFEWGKPKITFCTHLDTVPPYIPPTIEKCDGEVIIRGRGACDAKGQIISMYTACEALARDGYTDFGLLLLYGEETGSYGAKDFRAHPGGRYVIVGEPTDNRMVSASKGTKAFDVRVKGEAFHSGYPEHGHSAVDKFVDIVNMLRDTPFPIDPLLGNTTYNIGKLHSDNPQNILSPELTCRIYFRTTFASDAFVCQTMAALSSPQVEIRALGGDTPMHYLTLDGFETKTVAFGSDAPQLTNYEEKALCGPGSILVAHRDEEHIRLSDLLTAAQQYVDMYKRLITNVR